MSPPVLLYDGGCGFCAASVRFILRHERSGTLLFAAREGRFGASLEARHPQLARVDSVVWFEPASEGRPEQVLIRSSAALRVVDYLGGPWRLASIARLLPRRIRDSAYDLLARHRKRLMGEAQQCAVPGPDVPTRFLD